MKTCRFSSDTSSTLPPCSALRVEFTISCRVLYCRYTVLPRTCSPHWGGSDSLRALQYIACRACMFCACTAPVPTQGRQLAVCQYHVQGLHVQDDDDSMQMKGSQGHAAETWGDGAWKR